MNVGEVSIRILACVKKVNREISSVLVALALYLSLFRETRLERVSNCNLQSFASVAGQLALLF